MSEIPKHSIPKEVSPKARRTRRKNVSHVTAESGQTDAADNLVTAVVPTLAETLGASTFNIYGLRGRFGSFHREVTIEHANGDRTDYNVLAQRISDTNRRGGNLARIVLEVVICDTHPLNDQELIAEWPLLESLGAADDLMTDSFKMHATDDYTEEFDYNDPEINARLMRAQAEFISDPFDDIATDDSIEAGSNDLEDEDDDEDVEDEDSEDSDSLGSTLYGQEVQHYFQKTLRIVRGKQPTITVKTGFETDSGNYPVSLGDAYSTTLIGDTLAELDIFTQLTHEAFKSIDSQSVREFEAALAIVGIIKRKKGNK